MIRLSLLYFLIIGYSAQCFADATPIADKAVADKDYVESLSNANHYSGPSSNLLECQPKGAKKKSAKAVQTEAGVCPDCEQLKNSPFKDVLSVKEFINPLNVKVTAEDNANVAQIVEDSMNPYGVETKEQVESEIVYAKKFSGVYEMCATGNYNPLYQDQFIFMIKVTTPICLDSHIKKSLQNTKSLEIFKSYKLGDAPTVDQFVASCQVIYAERNKHIESVDGSASWFNAELEKQQIKLENLTIKLNKFSEKKTPEIKKDLPDSAVTAGAGKCGMTIEEYALLSSYTGSFYQTLNKALRGQGSTNITAKQVVSIVRIMNSGLAKIRAYQGITFRATHGLPSEVLAQHKPGKIIQFSSYLSTSTNKSMTGLFGGEIQYVIKSKSGRFVNPISSSPGENEVLFAPMTRFKITNVKTAGGTTIYEMDEL